ncbi:hypothetical protein A2U01_0089353, partial [Trifolium medium]|nr:hypothetical protein [Trifolium medium]
SEGEVEKEEKGVVENESNEGEVEKEVEREIEEESGSEQDEVVDKKRETKESVPNGSKDKCKVQESVSHNRVPYPRKKK